MIDSSSTAHYFVTYAHTDLWQARQVVDALREGGHQVNFEDRLTDEADWKAPLEKAISACDALIYMLSPESAASEWCQWELAQAVTLGKPVIGVQLETNTVLSPALKLLPSIDMVQGLTPEGTARLISGLERMAKLDSATFPIPASPAGKPSRAESIIKHVFLSYSRRDLELMKKTRDALRAANIAVWTDESIPTDSPHWQVVIAKAIEHAGCLLVILSPDAKQSPWVLRELNYAATHQIPIMSMLARGTEAESVPFPLSGAQYVDARSAFDTGISVIMGALRSRLQGGHSSVAVVTVAPTGDVTHAKPKLDDSFWNTLFRLIQKEKCTPFLGPSISAKALTPQSEAARKWAEKQKYPFDAYNGDLARVAQFLTFELGEFVAKEEIIEEWLRQGKTPDFNNPNDAHAILARLPFSLYVTTNYDDYLCDALLHHGKHPQRVYYYDGEWVGGNINVEPKPDQPMVMHLYGHQNESESLILSEDDHLRYLLKFARRKTESEKVDKKENDIITFPTYVTERIGQTSYLFIGFTASEWSFRTLFQILSTFEKKGRQPHFVVQFEPLREGDKQKQTERVENYLRNYLGWQLSATNVQVYVEETDVFLNELREQWVDWQKGQAANV